MPQVNLPTEGVQYTAWKELMPSATDWRPVSQNLKKDGETPLRYRHVIITNVYHGLKPLAKDISDIEMYPMIKDLIITGDRNMSLKHRKMV